jgi:hypothetical protein
MDEAAFAKKAKAEKLSRYKADVSADGLVWYKNLYRFTSCFIAGGLIKKAGKVKDCVEGVKVSLVGAKAPDQITNYFGDFRFDGLEPGAYAIVVDGKEIWSGKIKESVNIGNITIK